MKRTVLAIVVSMMMFCSVPVFAQTNNQPAEKVYVIYMGDMRTSSYVLENVQPVDFNGMKCLEGRHVDLTWVANKIVYIPIDKISVIIEYNSLSEYKESVEKFHQKEMENGG